MSGALARLGNVAACMNLLMGSCSEPAEEPSDTDIMEVGAQGGATASGGGSGGGGLDAGAGGSPTAGDGGLGAGGTSSGSAAAPDSGIAGADAAAPIADDGGVAAPGGCPTIEVQPVPGQALAIVAMHITEGRAVIRNASAEDQLLSADAQLCQRPFCVFLGETERTLAAGEELSVDVSVSLDLALTFSLEGGELALHDALDVDAEGSLLAYVSWGEGATTGPNGNGRETEAVAAGLWTSGERVALAPGAAGFVATGASNQAAGYTSVPAACFE